MNDYFLRAADEQSLYAALESAGVVTREDDGVWVSPGYALDVIGTIMQPIGTDANGDPIMGAIPGFHANLRGELTTEQSAALPVIPAPRQPVRVWAS